MRKAFWGPRSCYRSENSYFFSFTSFLCGMLYFSMLKLALERGYLFCKKKEEEVYFEGGKEEGCLKERVNTWEKGRVNVRGRAQILVQVRSRFSNPGCQSLSQIKWMSSLASLGACTAEAVGSFQTPNNAHKRSFEDAASFLQRVQFQKEKRFGRKLWANTICNLILIYLLK